MKMTRRDVLASGSAATALPSRCKTPVNLVQLPATPAEHCDVSITTLIDGKSLAQSLREPQKTLPRLHLG